MMRVYIAGPMTGMPEHNFPAFRAARLALIAAGFDAVSPLEINNETDEPGQWHACMRRDIAALMGCDAVALLDGWQQSRGALLEQFVAATVGIPAEPLDFYL